MNKRKVLFSSSLLVLSSPWIAAQDIQRPNVLLIYTDDVGYSDLSCYGAVDLLTPNIDHLAQQGYRFTDCHAAASTSTPSRYGLLTGEYPWRREDTGVAPGDATLLIHPDTYTLPKMFADAGYLTAAIGKWHLGLGAKRGEQDWNKKLPSHTPASVGFQYSYIMAATSDRVPCVWIKNGEVADYDPEHPIYVSYTKPFPDELLGRDHPELLTKLKYSHGHDMAIVNGISRIGYMKGGGKALWRDEDIADRIVDESIGVFKKAKEVEQPFFVYCATNDVHVPRYPHERFQGKSPLGLRGDAILQLDDTVGHLLAALEESGQLENTLIIFTSDNGPMLDDGYLDDAEVLAGGNLPTGVLQGSKYTVYEGGTRVPFIVYWPKRIHEAETRTALMSQMDLYASFAALLEQQLPEGAAPDSRVCPEKWWGKDKTPMDWVVSTGFQWALSLIQPKYHYIEPKSSAQKTQRVPWLPSYTDTGVRPDPQLLERHHSFQNPNMIKEKKELAEKMRVTLENIKQTAVRTGQRLTAKN